MELADRSTATFPCWMLQASILGVTRNVAVIGAPPAVGVGFLRAFGLRLVVDPLEETVSLSSASA